MLSPVWWKNPIPMGVSTAIERSITKLLAIELDNKATAEKWTKKLFTGFTPEDEKDGI